MKKTLYTLNIDNYEPEITAITFPLMRNWARKIGADFFIIKDRKFPEWPVVYEKFQIYELSKEHKNDWNIFFDADTMIHPDFFDFTVCLDKAVTFSHGSDFTPVRFTPDEYFKRDGRFIGKGNWCLAASDWCRDIWHPLEDITKEEAVANIKPSLNEISRITTPEHLIDDYTVSRNISRYGLKHIILPEVEQIANIPNKGLLWHIYNVDPKIKRKHTQGQLLTWAAQPFLIDAAQKPNIEALNQLNNQWLQCNALLSDFLKAGGELGQKIRETIEGLGVQVQ